MSLHYDWLIVGAGFAGAILAERLANQLGQHVLLIDRRNHIGGNAFDETDAAGIRIHRYGAHIFHTNAPQIVRYLSRFTRWRAYEHRVLARISKSGDLPFPINRTTLNRLYGLDLADEAGVRAFMATRAEPRATITSAEDALVSTIGRDLYERFYRGYTRKQWGREGADLDAALAARTPWRASIDDRYFTDRFQGVPEDGYTAMFSRMLDNPRITVALDTAFGDMQGGKFWDRLIYTGPIDEFFDCRFGALPYRSLEFRHLTLDQEWFQPVAVMNTPGEDVAHTRIIEHKHLTGQVSSRTTITHEYPKAVGEPYYPMPDVESQRLADLYRAEARKLSGVHFVGRLASYRYYNMDQVVGQALATARRITDDHRALERTE